MPRTKALRNPAETAPAAVENGTGNGNGHAAVATASSIDDLTELFENETAVIAILDVRDEFQPVKRDTGLRIEIGPLWSPEAREVAEQHRDRLKRLPNGDVDPEDPAFAETIFEQVVAVTKRWWKEPDSPEGIKLGGELLACTPENVRMIYTHPKLTSVYAQVREGYLDRRRFFGARQKTA